MAQKPAVEEVEISTENLEQVIKEYAPMIKYVANRIAMRLPPHIEVDDFPASYAGDIAPTMDHMMELLEFSQSWNRQGAMIVHCYAGVSRSTAAALTILCQYNPGREMEAAQALRRAAPHAKPNRRIIAIADRMLQSDNRLVEAVDAMGPGDYEGGGTPLVELPLTL